MLARLRALANHSDDAVRQALFEVFGPAGLGLLRDGADSGADVDLDDIQIVSTAEDVSFAMRLGQDLSLLTVPIDFDIGLPALGLEVDGDVNVRLGWDFLMGFGVSRSDGVYFNTAAKDNAGNSAPELTVDLEVTTPNLTAIGSLGFLQLQARDDETEPSRLAGRFTVDVEDPEDNDDRLSFAELAGGPDFDEMIDAAFTADADVNLDLDLSLGDGAAFPRLLADFGLDWSFAGADPGASGPFGGRPRNRFRQHPARPRAPSSPTSWGRSWTRIEYGAGARSGRCSTSSTRSFPCSPIWDRRAQLLDRDGDGAVTLLEMAALLGSGFDGARPRSRMPWTTILEVGGAPRQPSTGGTVLLDFGSFDLGSIDVRGQTDLADVDAQRHPGDRPDWTQFKNSGIGRAARGGEEADGAPGGGFVFPIIGESDVPLRPADGQGRHACSATTCRR